MDGLSMGLGYTFALLLISLIRQIIATGAIALENPMSGATIFNLTLFPSEFTVSMFGTPTGAFLTFAVVAAVFTVWTKKDSKKAGEI